MEPLLLFLSLKGFVWLFVLNLLAGHKAYS